MIVNSTILMNKLAYIPTSDTGISQLWEVSTYSTSTLADRIGKIMYSKGNWIKTTVFVSRAYEILWIDTEDEEDYIPSNIELSDKYPDLVRLYMTLKMYGDNFPDNELHKEFALAVKDRYSTVAKWQDSLYEVFQSIHGDVSVTRTELSTQKELFNKDWEDIVGNPSTTIRAYQETTPLVCALLVWYMKGGFPIEPLIEILKNLEWKSSVWCNAADAWTKNDELSYFRHYFEEDNYGRLDYIGIGIHYGSGNHYSTHYDDKRKLVTFGVYDDKKYTRFRTVIEIPLIDIPKILSMLCMFSWRSGEWGKILINWYIKRFGNDTSFE